MTDMVSSWTDVDYIELTLQKLSNLIAMDSPRKEADSLQAFLEIRNQELLTEYLISGCTIQPTSYLVFINFPKHVWPE